MNAAPRVGYDNVAFDLDGTRVIAHVIGYDGQGRLIVHNSAFDNAWHVPVEDATVTDEPENDPPADW